jgi:hypothetical protein
MSHDISGFADKLEWNDTCSYSLNATTQAYDSLKAQGMTEADLSKAALKGEYGVIKGKMQSGAFHKGDVLFKGIRRGTTNLKMTVSLENQALADWEIELMQGIDDVKVFRITWDDPHTADTLLTFEEFENAWLEKNNLEWSLGKSAKKIDVAPVSQSVGAMSDEDIATMFVKTKDDLAKQKGILDLKGTNKALDDEVYSAIGEQTGYTKAEVKAKVDAYKASGKKLSALKKKVVKKEAKVGLPKPHGVPLAPTKEAVDDAVQAVVNKVEDSPTIAAKVYQDQDVAAAYIKAKDDLAALESNEWTLYTQTDEFDNAIYNRMRDHYGITLDNSTIEKQIANYTGQGNKLSALKKKLANSKTDPWVPKADTLKKSKEASFHITPAKPGEGLTPPAPSFAGVQADTLSSTFDLTKLTDIHKDNIYAAFKNQPGTYLNSPAESIYEAALKAAKDKGPIYGFGEQDALTVLRAVDERGAAKFGVTNEHLFEKKVVEWLKSPAGKEYFQKKAAAEYWLKNQPPLPTESALFQVIDTSTARSMQTAMGDWTAEQRTALRTYTGGTYHEMNGYLRGKIRSISPSLQRTIKNAKAGMKRVTKNFLVHRGTGYSQFGVQTFEELAGMVGMDVTDEGFVSTSVGGRAAFSSNSVIMEIEVPKGALAAYLKPISNFPGENELLLAPGTRFRILRVEKHGHQTQVRLRVLI